MARQGNLTRGEKLNETINFSPVCAFINLIKQYGRIYISLGTAKSEDLQGFREITDFFIATDVDADNVTTIRSTLAGIMIAVNSGEAAQCP